MTDDRWLTVEHDSPTGDPEAWLRASWASFLQAECAPYDREEKGLQAVFRSIFPVKDSGEWGELVFVSYALGEPPCSEEDARRQGRTLAAGLKVTFQLMTFDHGDDGSRMVRDIKEQEVFFGELPVPTAHGTLIIDGRDCLLRPQRTPILGPSRADGLVVHGLDGDTLHLRRRPDGFEASLSLAEASWSELVEPAERGRALRLDAAGVSLVVEGTAPARVFVAPRDLAPDDGPGVQKRAQLTGKRFAAMQGSVFPLSERDATRFTLLDAAVGADGVEVASVGMALSPAVVRALVAAGVSQVRARLRDERPRRVTATGLADAEAVARWYGSTLSGYLALGEDGHARLAEVVRQTDVEVSEDILLTVGDVLALALALEASATLPDLTTTTHGPGDRMAILYQVAVHRIATEVAVQLDMHTGHRAAGEIEVLMPHDLLNARPASDAIDRLLGDRKDCEPVELPRLSERVRELW